MRRYLYVSMGNYGRRFYISSQFARGLEEAADMQVEVLASRSGRNDYGIKAKKYCCSYEELVNDKEVDAVYVGTIHPQHLSCVKPA